MLKLDEEVDVQAEGQRQEDQSDDGKGGDAAADGAEVFDQLLLFQSVAVGSFADAVELVFGDILCEADQPLSHAYFPMMGFISPFRTMSKVLPMARGSCATMPATMIMVMPLPMPRSVICSPSHMTNIVPVVMDTVAMNRNCGPGFGTRLLPAFWIARAAPNP